MIREFVVQVDRRQDYYGNEFVNVRPLAERRASGFVALGAYDQKELLPESEMGNININYDWSSLDVVAEVDSLFPPGGLTVIRFDPENKDELHDNCKPDGTRFPTGYRMYYEFLRTNNRLSTLPDSHIYLALPRSIIPGEELLHSKVVRFYHDLNGLEQYQFYTEFDGMWIGPFTAGYDPTSDRYEMQPELKQNGYVLRGYPLDRVDLAAVAPGLSLLVPKENAKRVVLDAAQSAEQLLDGLKRALSTHSETAQSSDEMLSIVSQHADNPVFGTAVPAEIRNRRLMQLKDLLSASDQMEALLGTLGPDVLRHLEVSGGIEEWLVPFLDAHPDMLGSIPAVQQERKKHEKLEADHAQLEEALQTLRGAAQEKPVFTERIRSLEKELALANERLAPQQAVEALAAERSALADELSLLKAQISAETARKNDLLGAIGALETHFARILQDKHAQVLQVEYDGFVARKVTEAAAASVSTEADLARHARWQQLEAYAAEPMPPEELIPYIVDSVRQVRPTYDALTILNAAICFAQGFLTIFSGPSGCGKTSLTNILADVLGLNSIAAAAGLDGSTPYANRYVPVSVEKGWSSKRDLLGYYNPLTKKFDESDRRLYEAMLQLNHEQQSELGHFPFLILLDEANLSQMEYYWSDFMNVGDNPGSAEITLGPDLICRIPDHLRFFATINNDDTTLPLSPRLIDRSWIITLPDVYGNSLGLEKVPPEQIRPVRWADLQKAFVPAGEDCVMAEDTAAVYEDLRRKFSKRGRAVSPRADKAIRRYCAAAAKCFRFVAPDQSAQERSSMAALDFAVSQRLLPKISGSGEDVEQLLKDLGDVFRKNGLVHSLDLLNGILQRGESRMNYYTFFY